MTSLLCVKTVNGDIEVHNKEIAADFTSDANAQPLTVLIYLICTLQHDRQ